VCMCGGGGGREYILDTARQQDQLTFLSCHVWTQVRDEGTATSFHNAMMIEEVMEPPGNVLPLHCNSENSDCEYRLGMLTI